MRLPRECCQTQKTIETHLPHQDMTVIVLYGRGIASPKVWRQIRDQGWRPSSAFMRGIARTPQPIDCLDSAGYQCAP